MADGQGDRMSKRKSDWTVLNAGKNRMECLRCGRFHPFAFPMELWAMTALMDGFAKEHKGCTQKPEGLHCSHCGEATTHDADERNGKFEGSCRDILCFSWRW